MRRIEVTEELAEYIGELLGKPDEQGTDDGRDAVYVARKLVEQAVGGFVVDEEWTTTSVEPPPAQPDPLERLTAAVERAEALLRTILVARAKRKYEQREDDGG